MSFHFQLSNTRGVPFLRVREKKLMRRGKEQREVVSTFGPGPYLLDSGQLAAMLTGLVECARKLGMDVGLTGSLRRVEASHEESTNGDECPRPAADGGTTTSVPTPSGTAASPQAPAERCRGAGAGPVRADGEGLFTPDETQYLRKLLRWKERTATFERPTINFEDLKEKLDAHAQSEEAR